MRQGQNRTTKTTLRSEGRSALKKTLTEPTLLEMSGYGVYRPVGHIELHFSIVKFAVRQGVLSPAESVAWTSSR